MKKYTIFENQLIDKCLKIVPRGVDGALPMDKIKLLPEWSELIKTHDEKSIYGKLYRRWQESLIPVKVETKLNHAFNFCPSCGFKLN